jgi:putative ABC transport system permease protein
LQIFTLQRRINEYPEEPLLAIIPGVALQELWGIVGIAETALVAVSAMVVLTALLGMTAVILSGLNERRREMAILRALGARPWTIMALLIAEALAMAGVGVALGVVILYGALLVAQPWLDVTYGLFIPVVGLSIRDLSMLAAVLLAAAIVSLVPALRAYRMSLADGMMVKS